MHVVPVLMAPSSAMETIATSQQLLFLELPTRRLLSSFDLAPLLDPGGLLTLPVMCMALRPASIQMRVTLVCCPSLYSYHTSDRLDIVGNNIPVFFIQDAILFPDLIHAVKPAPDREIPQAATAHDSAWDFFSQQPSSLHTLFWAMAGNGIPRSFRHMDGFGIHTFRLVTDNGTTKLVKWFWKSKQGTASLLWEEAQALAGKNSDFIRQDLWDAIDSGNGTLIRHR